MVEDVVAADEEVAAGDVHAADLLGQVGLELQEHLALLGEPAHLAARGDEDLVPHRAQGPAQLHPGDRNSEK